MCVCDCDRSVWTGWGRHRGMAAGCQLEQASFSSVTLGYQSGHLLFGTAPWYEWRHMGVFMWVCVWVLWYWWQAVMKLVGDEWYLISCTFLSSISLSRSFSHLPHPDYLLPPFSLSLSLPLSRQQRGISPRQYSSAQLCHFTRGTWGPHQPQVCLQGTPLFVLQTTLCWLISLNHLLWCDCFSFVCCFFLVWSVCV